MSKCIEPGCNRHAETIVDIHCSEHHLKCDHCGKKAAFAVMKRPECTNCWEVRGRLREFLFAAPNRAFTGELLVETGTILINERKKA